MAATIDQRAVGAPDPGAVDNRLSLDPNDPRWKKMLAKWEDGGRYPIKIGSWSGEIDQLSPGEFEIVVGEQEATDADIEAEEEAEPAPKVNRAVRSMMSDEGGY